MELMTELTEVELDMVAGGAAVATGSSMATASGPEHATVGSFSVLSITASSIDEAVVGAAASPGTVAVDLTTMVT